MSRRAQIIALSVVACIFGGLTLWGPPDHRYSFYAVNIALSVIASILASVDLWRRGYGWGWLMLVAYIAPLVGTILFVVFSGKRDYKANRQPMPVGG